NLHLHELGINSVLLPALDIIKIDMHGEPDEAFIRTATRKALDAAPDADLYITQGFICRNEKGETDNLQRGGSDYTASLIGALLGADEIEIWTDIDGMHNNDPRFVEGTTPVHNLHFEEAAELAYFGAKILHPTCILPARQHNVPVRLLNTMDPSAEGTLIENKLDRNSIKAVAAKDNITAIKIKSGRMLLAYGFLKKVFEIFEKYETSIDMITTSEVGVSLTIDNEKNLARIEAELSQLGTVTIDRDMVIICVVGDLEWTNKGFEAAALEALRNVPVRMISYGGSNYNISFLIRKEDKTKALRLLSYHLF
ncbi:MAG: aspartate kinase, partial [Muribaculaceae bacterium]|nr:aspartate kinase [Muribaculaceae bacterium]